MEDMRGYVLVPRSEWEDAVMLISRVDALMELILSDGSVLLPTVCRILDRPTVAKQVEEREEVERKKYAEWLKEKGVVRGEDTENNSGEF